MSRVRDIANILSGGSSAIATDTEIPSYVAGKNKLINGAFDIWQRGVTFAPGSITNAYGGDRWKCTYDDSLSGVTMSRVDIADLNIGFKYAISLKNTVGTKANANIRIQQAFETQDTHMMRGKTYTLSFYARKVSGASARITHMSGWTTTETNGFGSSDETQVVVPNASLTTTFQRFSQTFIASTNASYNSFKIQLDFQFLTSLNDELQVTGVQLEEGSVATPFSRAGGTIQGEIALCQRYYWRAGGDVTYEEISTSAVAEGSGVLFFIKNPVTMRSAPSSVEWSTLMSYDGVGITAINSGSLSPFSTKNMSRFNATPASAPTSYRPYTLFTNNSTNGYIAFTAEL